MRPGHGLPGSGRRLWFSGRARLGRLAAWIFQQAGFETRVLRTALDIAIQLGDMHAHDRDTAKDAKRVR